MSTRIQITPELRFNIHSCARTIFAPEIFNKVVASVGSTLIKGRLRYWQEELLNQLSRELGIELSMNEFVCVFQNDALESVPMIPIPKEDFLRTPSKYLYSSMPYLIPKEWVIEAEWTGHEFWEDYCYEFIRQARKTGNLECLKIELERCAEELPIEQMKELYLRIREQAILRESEFRPTFENVFGSRMAAFPRMLRRSEVIEKLGPKEADYCQAHGYLDHIPE